MFSNYLKLALRNLAKHRLYAFINVAGLAIGLTIYLFSTMLVKYELNHDHMFSERDRIAMVTSIFAKTSGEPINEFPGIRPIYASIFKTEISSAQFIARAMNQLRLWKIGEDSYYQGTRFVDPDFTQIFDFNYLHGNASALEDPYGLVLTASIAQKWFGRTDVLGQAITLDNQYDMYVAAVIEDLAADSHFNSDLRPDFEFRILAPIQALAAIDDFEVQGSWRGYANTYLLMPPGYDRAALQSQIDVLVDQHTPDEAKEYIDKLRVRGLQQIHSLVWDSLGFPLMETVSLLGLLVLLVACVNYTNLATAQSLGRSREVGLRKALGATRLQLLTQFLVESLTLAALAMLLALASIEIFGACLQQLQRQSRGLGLCEHAALADCHDPFSRPACGNLSCLLYHPAQRYRESPQCLRQGTKRQLVS